MATKASFPRILKGSILLRLSLSLSFAGIGALAASSADYSDFSSVSGLNLIGSATVTENRLRLTPASLDETGAVWLQRKIDVASGLETKFQFQITSRGGRNGDDGVSGGDGFAFVIQDDGDSVIGSGGGYLGYTGLNQSLAVEFDTYKNDIFKDPNGDHISVHSDGAGPNTVDEDYSLGSTTQIPNLSDGKIHSARILYQPGTLAVYLDDDSTPVLSLSLDLSSKLVLTDGQAWIGFTAATGEAYENHDLISWAPPADATDLPPGAVSDLKAQAISTSQIALNWSAPGGDGQTGQADRYDLRYSLKPISGDDGFNAATILANPPKPQPSGSAETMTASGLQPETRYYFALKAYDAAGNVSAISNVADAVTFGIPPTVVSTSPKDGDTGVELDAPILIAFSEEMDPNSVQVVVTPDAGTLSRTWNSSGDTLTLTHDSFQGSGTAYSVTVSSGSGANGVSLAAPYVFSFATKLPSGLAETPWPMYRHDPAHTGRNGYSGPVEPVSGVTWSVSVPSQFSSPAVGIDRVIYVGSQGSGLVAVTPEGQIKWKALESADWVHSSPAISKTGILYIGLPSGILHAIDPSDGSDLWNLDLSGSIASSPAISDDGTIYIGASNALYAITSDHQVKWKYSVLGAIYSSPAVDADGTVYFGSDDGALYSIKPDGTLKWMLQTSGGVRSSPMIAGDTVYFGSMDGYFYACDLSDGSVRWKYQADQEIVSSPAQGANGDLYIASIAGILYSINSRGVIQWSASTEREIEGSPSIDKDGVIYLGATSLDGSQGSLFAFDPTTGKRKWSLENLSPISSSPIIGADGTLYVGSGSQLLLIGQRQISTTPVVEGDLNGDGAANIQDATLALKMAVGLLSGTPAQIQAGDLNGDGEITIQDVTLILRKATGL